MVAKKMSLFIVYFLGILLFSLEASSVVSKKLDALSNVLQAKDVDTMYEMHLKKETHKIGGHVANTPAAAAAGAAGAAAAKVVELVWDKFFGKNKFQNDALIDENFNKTNYFDLK